GRSRTVVFDYFGTARVKHQSRARPPVAAEVVGERGVRDVGAIEGARKGLIADRARGARECVRQEAAEALGKVAADENLEPDGRSHRAPIEVVGEIARGDSEYVAHVQKYVVEHRGG